VLSRLLRIYPRLSPRRESSAGDFGERSEVNRRKEAVLTGPGLLFVVSGPSGAGKDTLVEGLKARHERLLYSVSATTRAPRPGEREAVDYFFLTTAAFRRLVDERAFLEWREYNENLYGMPRSFIEEKLREGYDIVAKPEVNGALAIKQQFPDAVLIFIVPDRFSYLRSRLEMRRTDTNEEIAARLEIAHDEFTYIRRFDYLVINEEARPKEAVDDLEAIVRAERYRIHRYPETRLKELEDS
jgi:guanylate kinase